MLIGFARVSTQDQTLDLQTDALTRAGCEKLFTDTMSGATFERLGLTLKQLIATITDLSELGIGFKSLQENMDTTTSGGKLTFHIFGALAEFEREVIAERTRAGLQAARSHRRVGGRPTLQSLDARKVALAKQPYADGHMLVCEICETLHIGRSTLYRYSHD
jgi:DNA invertase Pin-like site-specific DNA recombinase